MKKSVKDLADFLEISPDELIEALKGDKGDAGKDGANGRDGVDGKNGVGKDGNNLWYNIWQ